MFETKKNKKKVWQVLFSVGLWYGQLKFRTPVLFSNISFFYHQNPAFGNAQIRELTEVFVEKSLQVMVFKENCQVNVYLHKSVSII